MNCRSVLFFLIALSGVLTRLQAQQPVLQGGLIDSVRLDTHYIDSRYPRPGRAALLGIFPGGGQAYNKRWWKIPIVYAAIGTAGWFVVDNSKQYVELRDNYRWTVDENPETNPLPPYDNLSATALKKYRDQYKKYMEFSYLGLGMTYLLSIMEAYVDAHLRRFDVSDDLSLRFNPNLSLPGETALGLTLKVRF